MNEYLGNEILSYAMLFRNGIRKKQYEASGDKWTWETFMPGPLLQENCEMLRAVAGCWSGDCKQKRVRFYTNQNHPSWSVPIQKIAERGWFT